LALAHGVRGGLPVPYGILCVGGGAVTSILGAIFLDLHRRAIFHQRVLLERRRDEQLATLYDVTRTVAATLELQDVLRLVCQSVLHALGVERLWLFWREAPDGALRALAAERRDDQVALTDLPGDPTRWEPLLGAGASRVPALLEPTSAEIAALGGGGSLPAHLLRLPLEFRSELVGLILAAGGGRAARLRARHPRPGPRRDAQRAADVAPPPPARARRLRGRRGDGVDRREAPRDLRAGGAGRVLRSRDALHARRGAAALPRLPGGPQQRRQARGGEPRRRAAHARAGGRAPGDRGRRPRLRHARVLPHAVAVDGARPGEHARARRPLRRSAAGERAAGERHPHRRAGSRRAARQDEGRELGRDPRRRCGEAGAPAPPPSAAGPRRDRSGRP